MIAWLHRLSSTLVTGHGSFLRVLSCVSSGTGAGIPSGPAGCRVSCAATRLVLPTGVMPHRTRPLSNSAQDGSDWPPELPPCPNRLNVFSAAIAPIKVESACVVPRVLVASLVRSETEPGQQASRTPTVRSLVRFGMVEVFAVASEVQDHNPR